MTLFFFLLRIATPVRIRKLFAFIIVFGVRAIAEQATRRSSCRPIQQSTSVHSAQVSQRRGGQMIHLFGCTWIACIYNQNTFEALIATFFLISTFRDSLRLGLGPGRRLILALFLQLVSLFLGCFFFRQNTNRISPARSLDKQTNKQNATSRHLLL